MAFFDRYERFLSTSRTSPFRERLNGRYDAIIGHCREHIAGRRVLDIASHDGRWTFAALDAGARHVTGIEPRGELIDNARATFDAYGVAPERYAFLRGDVFDTLSGLAFDTVLCLGFYYHTARHVELMNLIERTGARFVVIDTEIVPGSLAAVTEPDEPRLVHGNPYSIEIFREPVDDQQMAALDGATRGGHALVGRPGAPTVEYIARHFGYECSRFDWPRHFQTHPQAREWMVDYHEGWRTTFYLSRA